MKLSNIIPLVVVLYSPMVWSDYVDQAYMGMLESETLQDTIRYCALLGYRRDSTVAVHHLTDEQQHMELEKQARRCACYSNFLNDVYAEQIPEEYRNLDMLNELIASSLFVDLEYRDRHFIPFTNSQYMSEELKYSIAFNTSNQCEKDYR